ncbi:MAG TPA: cell division protein ZipA C-terminal FtsZ-binding domain-containing protein [Povalibacter sp.]
MSELRWILIVIGGVLLIGIYFWGRRSSKRKTVADTAARTRQESSGVSFGPATVTAEPAVDEYDAGQADDIRGFDAGDQIVAAPRPQTSSARFTEMKRSAVNPDSRRARVEPTLGESASAQAVGEEHLADDDIDVMATAELPADEAAGAPTLSMSSTPPPRRIERRKIVALRLAASAQRYPGGQLRDALEGESLRHGKYDVFHRTTDNGDDSVFCVASMVEPGTFDLDEMPNHMYPGITLFAQLPGPVPGVHALHDLVACGKSLQETLGGTLQDDRGVPLTVHRIERLRQEVADFERGQGREHRTPSAPASP